MRSLHSAVQAYFNAIDSFMKAKKQPERGINLSFVILERERMKEALKADAGLAELVVKALADSMDGEEAPHPDVAAAYNAAYRIVHGEPEPERDEAVELPF